MNYREIGKNIRDYIGLKEWVFEFDSDGYNIHKKEEDNFYKLYFRHQYDRHSKQYFIYTIASDCNLKVEYLLVKYFPEEKLRSTTNPQSSKLLLETNEIEDCLPIWRSQYHEEVLPQLEQYKDLSYIHRLDQEAGWPNKVMGQPNIEKRLIIKRLLSKGLFDDYKIWTHNKYDEGIKLHPKEISLKEDYIKCKELMNFLEALDVEEYLRTKPWREQSAAPKEAESDLIITDQCSIISIGREHEIEELSAAVATACLQRISESSAGEASRLSYGGDHVIDLIQAKPSVILFTQDPADNESVDLAKASRGTSACRMIIDFETSDSVHLEYYRDGKLLYHYMRSDSEILHHECDPSLPYLGMKIEVVIQQIFEEVSDRRLDEIKEDEVAIRYKLITSR